MPIKQFLRGVAARLIARALPPGIMRDKQFFGLWQTRGWHAHPIAYDSPIPDTRDLEKAWRDADARPNGGTSKLLLPPGIHMRLEAQCEWLRSLRESEVSAECEAFPANRADEKGNYYRNQQWFQYLDAAILHVMIRQHRPRRVVEIGSGFSTRVTAAALELNRADGHPGALCAIEPYPDAGLRSGIAGLSELVAKPVQEMGLERFAALGANDILFIDSSHVARAGSDVVYELLEILPRLAPGVLVHVHDIFIPADYHREWLLRDRLFWNEQYMFQAFLTFNSAFEVLWAGSAMHLYHSSEIRDAFPSYDPSNAWPGSFLDPPDIAPGPGPSSSFKLLAQIF